MKPNLPNVTLIAVDTTSKAHLAERAILKSMEQCSFGAVKLLTDNLSLKYAVKIPLIDGLEGYSKFCIREMAKYVQTPYAIVCQADGYILRGESWTDEFLNWDFIGSAFNPSGIIGNGGFSGRSKRLLDYMANAGWDDCHPEDSAISCRHRAEIESKGMRIAPPALARKWGVEGRSWDREEWKSIPNKWSNELGFHSWLTPLPKNIDRPKIFSHSGDLGDVCYSLPVIKALGGGVLFLTPDNHFPFPRHSRWTREGGELSWVENLKPLLLAQDYIWSCQHTPKLPFSTDYDLNKFRQPWEKRSAADTQSIFDLHHRAFGTSPELLQENIRAPIIMPGRIAPWLKVQNPIVIPDKPIVVARSERYSSEIFEWTEMAKLYGDRMVFVGTEREAELFKGFTVGRKPILHYPTRNALELAQVIAGSKVVVCNQSLPLAIAHGLGKRVLVECWNQNPNCCLPRGSDAIYCHDEVKEIPGEWLK